MRAILLSLLVLAALAPPAAAETHSGSILVGHPLTQSPAQAVNDRASPCDPGGPTNGLDGVWFDLPGRVGALVTLDPDATLDADLYFWSQSCAFIPFFDCSDQGLGWRERCRVPAGTRFFSVEGWAGTGSFVLTVA